MLPCSEACERNKEPILTVLREAFAGVRQALGIGSGTGQHAVWFASHLAHLREREPAGSPLADVSTVHRARGLSVFERGAEGRGGAG